MRKFAFERAMLAALMGCILLVAPVRSAMAKNPSPRDKRPICCGGQLGYVADAYTYTVSAAPWTGLTMQFTVGDLWCSTANDPTNLPCRFKVEWTFHAPFPVGGGTNQTDSIIIAVPCGTQGTSPQTFTVTVPMILPVGSYTASGSVKLYKNNSIYCNDEDSWVEMSGSSDPVDVVVLY